MSAEVIKRETAYGIRWGDGTLETRADGGLWITMDPRLAAEQAERHFYGLELAHIDNKLWPKVVEFLVTTTYEEVKDAD